MLINLKIHLQALLDLLSLGKLVEIVNSTLLCTMHLHVVHLHLHVVHFFSYMYL